MFRNSKQCYEGQRLQACQVLPTSARARGYKYPASRYLRPANFRLANFASDRNACDRCIRIVRHDCSLGEVRQRVADGTVLPNGQSQSVAHHIAAAVTFGAVVLLLSVALTTFPFRSAHANDCLAAPNAAAPPGSHWYYHLNRATQQKCWYVRAAGTQAQHPTAKTDTGDDAPPSIRGSLGAPTAADAIAQDRAKRSLVRPTPEPTPNAVQNQAPYQSAPEVSMAANPVAATPESTSSETALRAAASPPAIWPDPPAITAVDNVQEASAAPTEVNANVVSEGGAARSGVEQANNFDVPIVIFPVLALGLVVVGIGARLVVRNVGARRVQVIETAETEEKAPQDGSERTDQYRIGFVQEEPELHSFISEVSDHEPVAETSGTHRPSDDISTREAKLARLCADIDRGLRSAEPTQAPQANKHTHIAEALLEG